MFVVQCGTKGRFTDHKYLVVWDFGPNFEENWSLGLSVGLSVVIEIYVLEH